MIKGFTRLAAILGCSMLLAACSSSIPTNSIQEETLEDSFVQVTFEQVQTQNCINIPAEHALMEKCGLDQECYEVFS